MHPSPGCHTSGARRGRRITGAARRSSPWIVGLLLVLGLGLVANGTWIHAKAALAQVLLDRAWLRTVDGGATARAWPWADTWPVARLQIAGTTQIVLAGVSGEALAFGPGLIDGSAAPGRPGTTVIAGHRDTHFRALRHIGIGDAIRLQGADGRVHGYRITATDVVHEDDARIRLDGDRHRLLLVTCWPFDAIDPDGPLRYLVLADPVAAVAGYSAADLPDG